MVGSDPTISTFLRNYVSPNWHHHYFYLILQIYHFIGYTPKNLSFFCALLGEI